MKLHAKAKVLIFDRLDKLEKDKTKSGEGNEDGTRDMYEQEIDFADV